MQPFGNGLPANILGVPENILGIPENILGVPKNRFFSEI
jgi:hypothetical protein